MLAAIVHTRHKKRAAHARNGKPLALPFGPVKGSTVSFCLNTQEELPGSSLTMAHSRQHYNELGKERISYRRLEW